MKFIIIFVVLICSGCNIKENVYTEDVYTSVDSLQDAEIKYSDSIYDYWGEKQDGHE